MNNTISEINIVRMFLYNESFRNETFHLFDSFMFVDSHCKEIFELIKDYSDKNGRFPANNVEVLIFNNPWKQDLTEIEEKLTIVRCDQQEYINADVEFMKPPLTEWVKERKFFKMLSDAATMYKEKNFDFSNITHQNYDIESFTFEQDDWVDSHDDDYMLKLHLNTENRVKFNSPIMNEMLGGGLKFQCLMLIMGGIHVGKSRALLSLATDLASVSPKRNVLYITLEIDKDTVLSSIDTHYFQMKDSDLRKFARQNQDEYLRMRKKVTETYGNVIVKEYPAKSVNAMTIRKLLDNFKKRGIEFCAVCVDYIALMKPIKEFTSLYEKGETAVELRAISQEYKIPVITPTQSNKEGNKKSKSGGAGADLEDVSESSGIPQTADVVVNLVMTVDQYKANRQLMYWLKNRPGHRIYETLLLEIMPWYQIKIMSFNDDDQQRNEYQHDRTIPQSTMPAQISHKLTEEEEDDILSKFGSPSFGDDSFIM